MRSWLLLSPLGCSVRSRFDIGKCSHQIQPPRGIVAPRISITFAGQESIFRDDGPRKHFSRSSFDRFLRGEVFVREIQKIAWMRMGNLRDFVSMPPNDSPALAIVRDFR